jgi:hypothetical protein
LPESAPLRFLVAARDGDDLLLFDTRLGLPVMTAAGKDVATLKQALQEPGLLKPSQFTQDDAKKLEAWLVCPLHALAPRMLELQKHIADPIVLHLDARKLQQDFAKITSIPVKTWSTNVEIATAGEAVRKTVTPARWLREFIPRQDGGVDETGRAAQWIRSRIPMQTAIANYDRIGLRQKTVPTPVALKLLEVTGILFGNYELTARELYLRGMHTPLQNRQQRLQKFVSDERLAGLVGNPEFDKERIEWVSKINAAYAEILSNPKMADRAAQAVQGYFMQDQLAAWLIDVNRELPLQEREPADAKKHDPKAEKPMLSRILAVGTREFFERELARATAQKSHENAELEQARLRAQAKPSAAARKDALDAWEQAKTGWANFYLDAFLLSTRVDEQIQRLRQEPLDGPKRLEMLETLHRDIHKHFQARLCLAECKQHLDGPAASCAYLEATRKELDTFDKDERLRDEIAKLKKDATDLPTQHPMRASIALLERDASATGAAFWLKQHIDQRIAALGKEPRTE